MHTGAMRLFRMQSGLRVGGFSVLLAVMIAVGMFGLARSQPEAEMSIEHPAPQASARCRPGPRLGRATRTGRRSVEQGPPRSDCRAGAELARGLHAAGALRLAPPHDEVDRTRPRGRRAGGALRRAVRRPSGSRGVARPGSSAPSTSPSGTAGSPSSPTGRRRSGATTASSPSTTRSSSRPTTSSSSATAGKGGASPSSRPATTRPRRWCGSSNSAGRSSPAPRWSS